MRKGLIFALFLIGFTSISSQVLLLREFLVIFYGNELSLGIILGNWLVSVALGSYVLGRKADVIKRKVETFALLQLLTSIIVPLAIYSTRIIKNLTGAAAGEMVGLFPMFYCSLIGLAPLCVINGFQFALGCRLCSDTLKDASGAVGRVYIYDALGDMLGGALFTLLLVHLFHSLQIAFAIGILNLASALILMKTWRKTPHFKGSLRLKALICLMLALNIYAFSSSKVNLLHNQSIRWQWKDYNLRHYQDSIYGNVTVIQREEQFTFFADGIPIFSAPVPDVTVVEELIHFPLLYHPEPKRVLLIGGGVGGSLREILKHPLDKVCYAELDPLIIEVAQKYLPVLARQELDNPRVEVKYIDGRLLVKRTHQKYDVAIVNLPPPSTLQLNRFYTREFFQLVNKLFNKDGILALEVPASETYMSHEMININRSMYETLREVFKYVRIIPGSHNLFLASSSEAILRVDEEVLVQRWQNRGLQTRLINPYYIRYKLNEERVARLLRPLQIPLRVKVNRDFRPVGTYYDLVLWNTIFYPPLGGLFDFFWKLNLWWIVMALSGFSVIFMTARKKRPSLAKTPVFLAILGTGFSGMTFNILIIFAFQLLYGYVYQKIGLITASFMVGLSLGSLIMIRAIRRGSGDIFTLARIEFVLGAYAALLPLLLIFLSRHTTHPFVFVTVSALLPGLNGLAGALVGSEFPLANKMYLNGTQKVGRVAGRLYASDLVGAWVASVLVAIVFIPILGILKTCLVVCLLKLVSLILLLTLPTRSMASSAHP